MISGKDALMIPRTIHYCWFGGNPLPPLAKKCIKSWRKYCPDYEIIQWDESNYDLSAAPLYVRQAYEAQKWAFVSDYVRLQIVYDYGGIYFDTDVELVKSPEALLGYSAYFGFEGKERVATGLGFGAEKGCPILARMLEVYRDVPFLREDGSFDTTPCPVRNMQALAQLGLTYDDEPQIMEGNVLILPPDYLNPMDEGTGLIYASPRTISIHHYAASWWSEDMQRSRKAVYRLYRRNEAKDKIRHLPNRWLRRILGEERYSRLKSRFRTSRNKSRG